MIVNIVDRRTNHYWVECDAVYEPAWQDNSIPTATKHIKDCDFCYDQMIQTTVVQALEKGREMNGSITLYLYDTGVLEGNERLLED